MTHDLMVFDLADVQPEELPEIRRWLQGPAISSASLKVAGRSMQAAPKARENARRRVDGASVPEPLYCTEEQVAAAVLGPGRLREWRERVPMLERDGLPLIDPLMGGRYLPAVKRFFEQRNGLVAGAVPQRVDGEENFKCRPPKQKPTRPALNGKPERAANVLPIGLPPAKP